MQLRLYRFFLFHFFFFFNDTATTEIYTLSLHDALPICAGWLACTPLARSGEARATPHPPKGGAREHSTAGGALAPRSEEHTSELQSRLHLVCRLLLEKKKKNQTMLTHAHTPLLDTSARD